LIKIKAAAHQGYTLFENIAQYSNELNIMSGKIKTRNRYSTEFYYGIGIIEGRKRDGIISKSNGGGDLFSGGGLPWTEYKEKNFISVGIPLEYKIQWRVFGLGIDGNLNPYLPYIGLKGYLKIGSKYKK
jgi:hypothetical protein